MLFCYEAHEIVDALTKYVVKIGLKMVVVGLKSVLGRRSHHHQADLPWGLGLIFIFVIFCVCMCV